jgi:hypothetical protein
MNNEHEEGFSEELLEKIRTLTQKEARALLDWVVPWEGERITMEQVFGRLMTKAARCPELSRETRNTAYRLARQYVERMPQRTIEVNLYADSPENLKDHNENHKEKI